MIIEIKIPSPGESITEVEIASWLVNDGDYVEKDQEIAEVESDKATLPLMAEESGIISIKAEPGKPISVGDVACTIDSEGKAPGSAEKNSGKDPAESPEKDNKIIHAKDKEDKEVTPGDSNESGQGSLPAGSQEPDIGKGEGEQTGSGAGTRSESINTDNVKLSPLAKKLMEEEGLTVEEVVRGLARISKEDVALVAAMKNKAGATAKSQTGDSVRIPGLSGESHSEPSRDVARERMSMLRRNLSKRLVSVKNETAMLTTFNEVDMSTIIGIRKKYQNAFTEKHGIKLGFMSFFTKAVTETLKKYPNVNSFIDGEDVVTPGYCDIGIAVQTGKGLMVPVIRNAEVLGLAQIEKKILELAEKARKNRISIDDMTGGTFTITNGGIFGSLLSTPILNPPQSGILGMHNIVERPVAINGRVEIRPMMYIALSYDHRIIDGRDSVSFLVKLKEILENPARIIFNGSNPEDLLLDLL